MYILILTLALFVTFLILLISGIIKRNRKLIYASLLALGLSIVGGICVGVIIAGRIYHPSKIQFQ